MVRLVYADRHTGWQSQIGRIYRIGYYSPNDGLQTVWLVDDDGEYNETCPQYWLRRYFKIERLSTETDFWGQRRRRLARRRRCKWFDGEISMGETRSRSLKKQ